MTKNQIGESEKSTDTETDPPARVELDRYDKAAVLAMLIRQIRYQNIVAEQEPIKATAEALINEAKASIKLNREALKSFGFDQAGKELWDQVKYSIGEDAYFKAFDIAKKEYEADHEMKLISDTSVKSVSRQVTVVDKRTESIEGKTETSEPPNIRDLIINKLKRSSKEFGVTSAVIRRYLENDLHVSMHEKTVGMTLYRLSRDGLVRREGRNWFYIPTVKNSAEDEAEKKEGSQVQATSEP